MSMFFLPLLFSVSIIGFVLAAYWKVFEKAGQPGWSALIPIYNAYIFLKIAGKPGWWLLLYLIPGLNLIMMIITTVAFAERFGKSTGFVLLLLFFPIVAIPILGFGDAVYVSDEDLNASASLPNQ